ncbi:hypothetical protein WJX77_011293 [Trebouxia sp. C0004]
MNSYCPTCANLLLLEFDVTDLRYYCETCPYVYNVDRQISKSIDLKKKEVEDVLGGPDSWKGAPKSDATCEKCGYHQAYFNEIQIRSADEPATLFFKCVKCGNQWREG